MAIVQVTLPTGDPVWVRIEPSASAEAAGAAQPAQDVVITRVGDLVSQGKLTGFTEVIRGLVASVQGALEHCQPEDVSVEFGIEINAQAGRVLCVLAEAGGQAHVNVTASWHRQASELASGTVPGARS